MLAAFGARKGPPPFGRFEGSSWSRADTAGAHRHLRCSGSRPRWVSFAQAVYRQITDTTGMLISGKMSIGMTVMAETPRNRIRVAKT
jgi:hypothetical protein